MESNLERLKRLGKWPREAETPYDPDPLCPGSGTCHVVVGNDVATVGIRRMSEHSGKCLSRAVNLPSDIPAEVLVELTRGQCRVLCPETRRVLHTVTECDDTGIHLDRGEAEFYRRLVPNTRANVRTWGLRFELLRAWLKTNGCRVLRITRMESLRATLDELPEIQDATPTAEPEPWESDRLQKLDGLRKAAQDKAKRCREKLAWPDGHEFRIGRHTVYWGERYRAITEASLADAEADLARIAAEVAALKAQANARMTPSRNPMRASVPKIREGHGRTLTVGRERGTGLFAGAEFIDTCRYPDTGCRFA